MIEKMKKIYEGLIAGYELTTQGLFHMGLTSKDLTELVKSETSELVRVKRGEYKLSSLDGLFLYGENFRLQKDYEQAKKVYQKCYEINPNYPKPYFQLFLQSLFNKDNQKTVEYFDRMYHANGEDEICRSDNNCYLLLLNEVLKLPNKYQEIIQNLKLEDVLLPENNMCCNDVEYQNQIRKSIFNKKFDVVLSKLCIEKTLFSIITISLCNRMKWVKAAIKKKRKINKKLYVYLQNQEYEEVVSLLELPENEIVLNLVNSCFLGLSRALLEIRKTGEIPEKRNVSTDNLFIAIKAKDYALALDIALTNDANSKSSQLFIQILIDIYEEIKKIEGIKKQEIETSFVLEDAKIEVEEIPVQKKEELFPFISVLEYLRNKQVEQAIQQMHSYLQVLGKEQYTFLLDDLIKISIIIHDLLYQKVIVAFTCINKEKFMLDISSYVESFYNALKEHSFEEAELYLHIISSSKLDLNFQIELVLEKAFDDVKQRAVGIEKETRTAIIQTNDFNQNNEQVKEVVEENTVRKKTPNQDEMQSNKKISEDRIKIYVDKKIGELGKVKGLVLLNEMSREERKVVHTYIESLPNVTSFSIGTEQNRRVVLRYIDETLNNAQIDFKYERSLVKEAFANQDYSTCIKISLKLLSQKNFRANKFDYKSLAFASFKRGNKERAITYFTIVTELNKINPKYYNVRDDYSDLIAELKGEIPEEDRKKKVKVDLREFEKSDEEDITIRNLQNISKLVFEENLSIDEACNQFQMDEEEILIIKLEFARLSYMKGDTIIGDQILKIVEQSEGKSKVVLGLLDDIRRNRNLYAKKSVEDEKIYELAIPHYKKFKK